MSTQVRGWFTAQFKLSAASDSQSGSQRNVFDRAKGASQYIAENGAIWYVTQAVGVSTDVLLQLDNLTDANGQSVVFTSLRAVYVFNTGDVEISVTSSNSLIENFTLKPGELIVRFTPHGADNSHAVVNGSSDTLNFSNNSETTAGELEVGILGDIS